MSQEERHSRITHEEGQTLSGVRRVHWYVRATSLENAEDPDDKVEGPFHAQPDELVGSYP